MDVLIWQARDTADREGTVPVSRSSLSAILGLAESGLVHADQVVMAEAQEAIDQIRAVLADGEGDGAEGTGKPGPDGTSESTEEPK